MGLLSGIINHVVLFPHGRLLVPTVDDLTNRVRLEMTRVAAEAGVAPMRVSFIAACD